MKKLLSLSLFTAAIFLPFTANAAGWVTCDGFKTQCTWASLTGTLTAILQFIINTIAVPLGTLAIIIGAIILMISAGNPKLAGTGKTILFSAIIGLALALCAKLIINFVLQAIGYNGRI